MRLRHPWGARRLGALGLAALGAAAVANLVTRPSNPVPPAPTLGAVVTVDSNDVGDPNIIAVHAGVAPPTDVPYQITGRDAYVSAPWTTASAAKAKKDGWYVLYGTTDWHANVPTAISVDLVHWTQAPDSMPTLPTWAAKSITMTWGPAVIADRGTWTMFFSTEERASKRECIGRALSTKPTGPFVDSSAEPLICQRSLGGSIDPSIVRTKAGLFVTWKNDGNSNGSPTAIWSQRLSDDGARLEGSAHRLIVGDAAWERGIVEAPAMFSSTKGGTWLTYSGGNWRSTNYGTGLAFCQTPSGPCRPTSPAPYLATTSTITAPGGLDTFTDLSGHLWVAFTALKLEPAPWYRGPRKHFYFNRVLDIAPVRSH